MNERTCIDFDQKFGEYAEQWISKNRARFKNADEMEEQLPDIYIRWLNTPADWLDGTMPGIWFEQYNADTLIDWMRAYHEQNVSLPDLLLSRVSSLGDAAVDGLLRLADDAHVSDETDDHCLRVVALNLLNEIGSPRAKELCVRIIRGASEQNALTDTASELLINLGASVVPMLLDEMNTASDIAREAFLDVLCNFPGDKRIYDYTAHEFLNRPERRALFASYLAKLGDERALEPLRRVLELSELNYLDYIEIANAIEALGGEVETTREFNGDPYYESLKRMQ